ncbi:MAG: hypothetical protein U9Q06_01675 [Nanoarchaeota archaeon]|nr:hypothetical protein [Nanoarchaeota archaeon]
MNKKGQIAIFVIVAVVLIAAVILFFLIRTDVIEIPFIPTKSGDDFDFETELEKCILDNEELQESISQIVRQGGSSEPEFYYTNLNKNYEYLCYTNSYYETCVMQRPFPLQHIEEEIKIAINDEIQECFSKTKEKAKRDFEVSSSRMDWSVDFVQENMIFNFEASVTLTSKDGNKKRYNEFEVKKSSELYDLIMLASSILNYEARYGDSDIDSYMIFYPKIRVEKIKQGEGTTVYFVSDRDSCCKNSECNLEKPECETFNFAMRSWVLPPGYGLGY